MAQPAPARPKINTKPTQAWDASGPGVSRRPARGSTRVRGEARESARGRAVIELDAGITVYPPQENGGRWRAVWIEDGRRRYCEAVTEAKLATRLAKITERLEADAPGMERPGSRPDRLVLVTRPAPRRRAVVPQARAHPAAAVRAIRVPGHREHDLPGHPGRRHAADRQRRVHRPGRRPLHAPISALVGAGIRGEYLANARLKEVHWHRRRGPADGRAEGDRGRGVAAVRRSRRDPRARRCRQARPGPGRAWARGV